VKIGIIFLPPERHQHQQVEPPDGNPVRRGAGQDDDEVNGRRDQVPRRRRDGQNGDRKSGEHSAEINTAPQKCQNSPKIILSALFVQ